MRAAGFIVISFLIFFVVMWWRGVATWQQKYEIKKFVRKHWWVWPSIFLIMGTSLMLFSHFSVKVF